MQTTAKWLLLTAVVAFGVYRIKFAPVPVMAYKIAEETGKEHHKEFRVTVSVSGHRAVGRARLSVGAATVVAVPPGGYLAAE